MKIFHFSLVLTFHIVQSLFFQKLSPIHRLMSDLTSFLFLWGRIFISLKLSTICARIVIDSDIFESVQKLSSGSIFNRFQKYPFQQVFSHIFSMEKYSVQLKSFLPSILTEDRKSHDIINFQSGIRIGLKWFPGSEIFLGDYSVSAFVIY